MSTSARRTIPTSRTSIALATPTTPMTCKYGMRDYRGGGRPRRARPRRGSRPARIARKIVPGMTVRAALIQMGSAKIDRARWDWDEVERNPFFCPDAAAGEIPRRLSRRHPQARLLGRRRDRGRRRRRPAGARRAGLWQARRRSRRRADEHQRRQGRRDRRRLCARQRSAARRTPTRCAWATTASRCFLSNHAGGILGGISTGQPVVARFAVKPTSSILTPRRTVDRYGHETEISHQGPPRPLRRHPRGADRRGHGGMRDCRPLSTPARPDGRRIRRGHSSRRRG